MRRRRLFGICIATILLLTGCGVAEEKKPVQTATESEAVGSESTEIEAADTEAADTEAAGSENTGQQPGLPEIQMKGTAMENSILLFDLLAAQQEADANVMFSPLSLNYALGLLAQGASGNTKAQLDQYLGTEDFGTVAKGFTAHAQELNVEHSEEWSSPYKEVFEIANSLWINSRLCSLKEDYASGVAEDYAATIENPDFGDPAAVAGQVNDWCNEKTHGMIPKVLSADSIDSDTAAILANSIYFESPWQEQWNLDGEEENFTRADGTEEKTQYMRSSKALACYENEKAAAFAYAYTDGLWFVGILPKEEGAFTLDELDIPALLQTSVNDYDVLKVSMPRLNFENTLPLNAALNAIGLTDMFSPQADFSEMSEDPLYVSDALQKTKLELDENGTRAAAVTVMSMKLMSAVEKRDLVVREIDLNRAFAFAIYDPEEEQLIFLGKVNTSERQ